jgi:ABC-type glycerol-3-phosphate transport system permease component
VTLNVIPQPITTAGWEYALTKLNPPLPVLFANSAILALAVTISNLVLGSIAGYAFARLRFPGREILFLVVDRSSCVGQQPEYIHG